MRETLAIIGAGPAGLAAALRAAQLGVKVKVFEKATVGEEINCAEGFFDSARAWGKPRSGIRYQVESLTIEAEEQVALPVQDLTLYMLDRRVWQRHLAEQASLQGADIIDNNTISGRNLGRVLEEHHWVIDASGVPCVTSLLYGFRDYYLAHSLSGAHYVVEGDFSRRVGHWKVRLFPDFHGYFWVFPKDDSHASVGVAQLSGDFAPETPGALWSRLHTALKEEGLEQTAVCFRSGGLSPGRMLPQLVYDRLLLAGDAAGVASPLHGGGMDRALLSGTLAAEAVAQGEPGVYSLRLRQKLKNLVTLEEELAEAWVQTPWTELNSLLRCAGKVLQDEDYQPDPEDPEATDLWNRAQPLLRYWLEVGRGRKKS